MNLEGHSSGPTPLFSPHPTLPAGPLAPALVNVTSEGATGLRAFWVHALGGRDGYRVTLYQLGVRVRSSRVGAQVDSASFAALTPGTEYEVEVVTQAGPLHAVAASATGWTREWAWGRGGEERWAGPPRAPPPACGPGPAWVQRLPALLPQPQWRPRSCWCPCGRAVPWSAWPGPAAPWGTEPATHSSQGLGSCPGSSPWPWAKPAWS